MKWWIWRCWNVLQPVVEHLVRRRIVLTPTWPFVHCYLAPYDGHLKRYIVEMFPWCVGPPRPLAEMLADDRLDFLYYQESPQPMTWRIDDHS